MRLWALGVFRWWCAFVAHWFVHFETDPNRLPVGNLKNISPRLGRLLHNRGIQTRADLVRLGSLEVYRLLLEQNHPPSQMVLLSLHGAITEQDWQKIPVKEKNYLLEEAKAFEHIQVR